MVNTSIGVRTIKWLKVKVKYSQLQYNIKSDYVFQL